MTTDTLFRHLLPRNPGNGFRKDLGDHRLITFITGHCETLAIQLLGADQPAPDVPNTPFDGRRLLIVIVRRQRLNIQAEHPLVFILKQGVHHLTGSGWIDIAKGSVLVKLRRFRATIEVNMEELLDG